MAILTAQSLSKSYTPESKAISKVSFDIQKGQILSILGQSGSGKTTLIKLLAGLLQPDEGQVLFNGERLAGPADKLVPGHEQIRLVHQDFKLYHRMTVTENIKNALTGYISEYKKQRTEELLNLCHITAVKDQYVHEISGGEKQRVAIAMALATEPEVLLFDEPFSNLDYLTKTELLQEVDNIAKATKTTVALITHDSRDAMEIADQIVVLHQGKVIRQGTPLEIYQQPEYRHVANLLGLHTVLSASHVAYISEKKYLSKGSYGVWAEDVLLHHPEGEPGIVKKVIFTGPANKLLIAGKEFNIWAYDYIKNIRTGDKLRFSLKKEHVFVLKP